MELSISALQLLSSVTISIVTDRQGKRYWQARAPIPDSWDSTDGWPKAQRQAWSLVTSDPSKWLAQPLTKIAEAAGVDRTSLSRQPFRAEFMAFKAMLDEMHDREHSDRTASKP